VVSARNSCHRMERGPERLLRLLAFQMREIVFFGDEERVEDLRLGILAACGRLLDGWGLRYRVVTASDPFFLTGVERRAVFQQVARSKLELQLEIPHRGEHVAVMSFNHHRRSLARAYQLEPSELASGCFGVGLERLLYALAAQHGPDPDRLAAIVAA
jgi:seryl-tRNA synthetase